MTNKELDELINSMQIVSAHTNLICKHTGKKISIGDTCYFDGMSYFCMDWDSKLRTPRKLKLINSRPK